MKLGGGYTIVETMLFLAITVVLFTAVITTVSGRQQAVQFDQSTRGAQSQFAEVVNQVSTGYYNNTNNFTCTVSGTGRPVFNSSPSPQGSSTDCIFIGKAIKFYNSSNTSASNYDVISLAARRKTPLPNPREVVSIDEAAPVAIAGTGGAPNVTVTGQLEFGLSVTRVVVPGMGQFGTVLILSTLPKFESMGASALASAAQQVSFGVVRGSQLQEDFSSAVSALNSITSSNVIINPPGGIVICMADDPNIARAKRKAMATLGEGASQAAVKLDTGFYNTSLCEG